MELWIIITIAAAFFQNIRSTVQKYLKSRMSTTGATFVRFGFGVPFALLYFMILLQISGGIFPGLNGTFWFWAAVAAVAQIIATFLLLQSFSYRNFTVGTALSHTEPAHTALLALLLFQETISTGGVMAIAISIVGVMIVSVARTQLSSRALAASLKSPPMLLGLGSGTLFGLAAVGYREAAISVEHELFFMRAAVTLCYAITLQTVLMLVWLYLREREQFNNILKAWRPSLLVGFVGATASFGWFSAFTLQQAALVKVVAQIEMLFTYGSSVLIFREHVNRMEIVGCILITVGIMLLFVIG